MSDDGTSHIDNQYILKIIDFVNLHKITDILNWDESSISYPILWIYEKFLIFKWMFNIKMELKMQQKEHPGLVHSDSKTHIAIYISCYNKNE